MERKDSRGASDPESGEVELERVVTFQPQQQTNCLRKLGDLNNIVKAFIGSSYLSLPFGFFQSGLALGCIALVIIVGITDHCCQLIVKCKKYLVQDLCDKYEKEHSKEDLEYYRNHLEKDLRYADVGRLCFGKWGVVIVDIFLVITQTGFCIAYFIFIGNTLHAMFPLKEVTVQLVYPWQNISDGALRHVRTDHYSFDSNGRPIHGYRSMESYLHKHDLSLDMIDLGTTGGVGSVSTVAPVPYLFESAINNVTTTESVNTTTGQSTSTASNTTTGNTTTTAARTTTSLVSTTTRNVTTAPPTTTPLINTTTVLPTNDSFIPATNTSDHVYVSSAPNLMWLVLVPLLPFILFAFIRNIRKLGSVSLMANLAIFTGYFVILIYMLVGFKMDPAIVLFRWETFPVFFGQTVCAFEGIGLVLPVEASMEGNRKNFPKYLHGALFLVSCILSSFGIVGYLRYGPHVQQVIVNNLPPFSILSMCVDACLILAIGCTYPLQVFPVVEILERYIFKIGHVHDSSRLSGQIQSEVEDDSDSEEYDNTLDDDTERSALLHQPQPKPVPTWKRNILRSIVVLVMCGLSVLLRHNFAYIGAFVGSCGSTALAYVLPCIFHIKIKGRQLHPAVIAKNVIIVIVGIIGGVVGVIVTVRQIIDSFKTEG